MKYRSNKHDIDAGGLIFIGFIILYVISAVCVIIGTTQAENNRHIERMKQIEACQEGENERL